MEWSHAAKRKKSQRTLGAWSVDHYNPINCDSCHPFRKLYSVSQLLKRKNGIDVTKTFEKIIKVQPWLYRQWKASKSTIYDKGFEFKNKVFNPVFKKLV